MMNETNPYQSSAVNPSLQASQQASSRDLIATPQSVSRPLSAKGWVRFISVMIFLYLAFIAVIGFIVLVEFGGGGGVGSIVLLLMVVMAGITLKLGISLSAYASAMSRLNLSRGSLDLEAAMVAQSKFWVLSGILSIVYIVIAIVQMISSF